MSEQNNSSKKHRPVWGFGFKFAGTDSKFDDFINDNFVCIGYKEDEAPEFIEMMKEIQVDDIIFLKTWRIRGSVLYIRAIGVVTEEFTPENRYNTYNKIGVKWLITDINQPKKCNTKYRQRVTSIFKEYNQEVIAILDSLLKNAGYENLLYYDN